MKALAARFVEESSLQFHSFLCAHLAESLESGLRALDERDGLGSERRGRIPFHTAGVSQTCLTSDEPTSPTVGDSCEWTIKGPPHTRRYCTLRPHASDGPKAAVFPRFANATPDAILRALQDELFPSPAFRAWLAIVTYLISISFAVEARRFRPGLDYTLATCEEKEARLDVVLGLTPTPVTRNDDQLEDKGRDMILENGQEVDQDYGWQSGTWGGWEVSSHTFMCIIMDFSYARSVFSAIRLLTTKKMILPSIIQVVKSRRKGHRLNLLMPILKIAALAVVPLHQPR